MKAFKDYMVPVNNDDGVHVAYGFDVFAFARDAAKQAFPLEHNAQKGFVVGFVEAFKVQSFIQSTEQVPKAEVEPAPKVHTLRPVE